MFDGLPSARFSFLCKEIEASRIFDKQSAILNETSVGELRNGVLYYANECKDSHPAADIWFRSDEGEVVLVEVGGGGRLGGAGGGRGGARGKVRKMKDVLVQNGPLGDLIGVVLLPNIATELETEVRDTELKVGVRLTVVTGARAQRLLGGLSQLLTWLRDDSGECQQEPVAQ